MTKQYFTYKSWDHYFWTFVNRSNTSDGTQRTAEWGFRGRCFSLLLQLLLRHWVRNRASLWVQATVTWITQIYNTSTRGLLLTVQPKWTEAECKQIKTILLCHKPVLHIRVYLVSMDMAVIKGSGVTWSSLECFTGIKRWMQTEKNTLIIRNRRCSSSEIRNVLYF